MESRWAEWAEGGQQLWERNYLAGILNGDERLWHDNGVLRQFAHHENGQFHCDYDAWYRNAQAEYHGVYVRNRGQGIWTYWHLNGVKRGEGTLVDGLKADDWHYWDENGNPVAEMPPRSDDSAY